MKAVACRQCPGRVALLFALGGAAGLSHAQALPDAGAIRQQIERDVMPRKVPEQPRSPLAPLPEPTRPAGTVTLLVRQFRFAGNTLLSDQRLAEVVAPWVGRTLDFNELQRVALAVAQAYRDAGWVVRADLPRQDVTDGVVTLQIDEARLGRIDQGGKPPTRVPAERIARIVQAQQPVGAPLSATALDRAVLLIDDLPGVSASAALAAGSGPRETDLDLALTDEPLVNGTVTGDNRGARSTGSNRIDAGLAVNSPLRMGDQLNASIVHTQGSDYGRLGFSVPVGYDGWRIGANASVLRYRLVAEEFRALDAHGRSSSVGLEASYPLRRALRDNVFLQWALDRKSFDNQANGATTSRYSMRDLSIGLSANRFDDLGAGGFSSATATLVAGRFDAQGSGPRTDGSDRSFRKLRYALSRQQTIDARWSLQATLSGQFADNNLDSSERFYLGGPNGVRAYPANEAGGTLGQLLNLEARRRLSGEVTLAGFYDRGWITQYRDNASPTGTALSGNAPNRYALQGAGLALWWSPRPNLQLQATLAHRIGHNPNPSATGNDQDGSLRRTRLWVGVILAF